MQYYLCFKINKVPDLSMVKYSVYDISGQKDLLDKHSIFLRQLHRLGVESKVFFHLLYFYDGQEDIEKGKRLQIIFYATAESPKKLELIREFVTTSVLSTYYDFYCYEISSLPNFLLEDGYLTFTNLSGNKRRYKVNNSINLNEYEDIRMRIRSDQYLYCSIQPGTNEVVEINSESFYLDAIGRICCEYSFNYGAYLTKKDYHLYAQNRLYNDPQNTLIPIYAMMEWIPNELGRLYNVLKLMEGYNETAALRIDLFPVDMAESYVDNMAPIVNELRQRMAQHDQGRDDNCDTVLKSIDSITKKLMKFPQFYANIVALADHKDIAIMLADSVGAEAVESGSYLVKELLKDTNSMDGFSVYSMDDSVICDKDKYGQNGNYMSGYVSLYTLDEVRPMFSFPVLYSGETIECMKETDPEFNTFEKNSLFLGISDNGYSVDFPIKLLKKHAFVAGVPGAGKTNTLLHIVNELWTRYRIPFLVLEPAKQEYRALAKTSMLRGMESLKEVCIFSPGADTRFPLHINPFEFPIGLTLAEHIANLNSVFAGAFELPAPSPHFIDTCIEQVYLNKGWNVNSRNTGDLPYPTMQELFDSLNVAVRNSHYQGETLGNLRSVLEVRIGSLLKREIGNVYNVEYSSFKPEEWIERPVIIELEALGEGPANFMALLISTLIRETLKIRKIQNKAVRDGSENIYGVNHVIVYEEAHNLVGPTQETIGDKVDPKVSATKFLVKMLAEVRALDEGIIIADQLPTVMAPEVLKNTGLKIGHRITANDDRTLLGSTMSASNNQIAEQSLYLPGEALVFYEGLYKPFKMQMAMWKRNLNEYCNMATEELKFFLHNYYLNDDFHENADIKNIEAYFLDIYDSPTDEELWQIIHNNQVYKEMMHQSMEIILRRVYASFMIQYECINSLNQNNIYPAYEEARKLKRAISKLKKQYTQYGDNAKEIMSNIEALKRDFTDKRSKYWGYWGSVEKTITSRIDESNNILISNIAIVKNYVQDFTYMSSKIIESYLHIFERIDWEHLKETGICKLILERIAISRTIINEFVNLDSDKRKGILADTEYYQSLFELGHYIVLCEIIADFEVCHKKVSEAIDWRNQKFLRSSIDEILDMYAKKYFYWMQVAQRYSENVMKIQAIVTNKYLEMFEIFEVFKDKREIYHYIFEKISSVRNTIQQYVSWDKDSIGQKLQGELIYQQIEKKCKIFTKLDIYEIFYSQAKSKLDEILKEVNYNYDLLNGEQLFIVSKAYIGAYYDAFDICKVIGDKELLAESIDLFYTLIFDLGLHLKGTAKMMLDNNINETYNTINMFVRKKIFSNVDREYWKEADEYWKNIKW